MFPNWRKSFAAAYFGAQLFSGLWGRMDVYVYNVGAGNFIRVLWDCPNNNQKELIVDCGSKNGIGAIERIIASGEKIDRLRAGTREIRETMLWVTHLHEDHYNGLGIEEGMKHELCSRIGTIIIGGSIEQAKQCGDFGHWIEQRIQQKKPVLCLQIGNYKQPNIKEVTKNLNSFQNGCVGNLKLFAIVPVSKYYKLNNGDNENAQSLVLGIEYNGVKILFPGDAPGKIFQALPEKSKDFVQNTNILIAPHHGSFEADNEWWWAYDRDLGNSPLYCVIASCDPRGHRKWNLPKEEFQEKGKGYMAFRKRQSSKTVAYYNKCTTRYYIKKTYQAKFVTCTTEYGYHVVVKDEPSELLAKIKIFQMRQFTNGNFWEMEMEMLDTRNESGAILVMPSDREEEITS
jgi:hypothetical protein